jgi:hypothetical protein
VITYRTDMLDDPMGLVATFAHELAHYRLSTVTELPPGGREAIEPATDLASVFMGFGLFLANSAFNFDQFQDISTQGWSYSKQGYLGEADLAYALAIFTLLTDTSPKKVRRHLDLNPRSDYKSALKDLKRRRDEIEQLRRL